MASSTKLVCFFFLLTTLLSSLQTHARDSQFFSKVSRNRDETTIPTNNLNKNQENDASLFGKPLEQEEQPVFNPETSESAGYGLYGHESGLDAPSTTTTAAAAATATPVTATPSSSLYNMDDNQNLYFDNNKNEKFENSQVGKNYVPELTGLSETSYTNDVAQNRYNNNNNFNDKYENFGNNKKEKSYVPELAGLSETSYTNDVVPKKYVAQNRYDNSNNYFNNNNNNNNYENNQEEKNYVPELTGLSESSYENEMVPSKYVDENKYKNMYSSNNFNNKNNNGDAKYYSGSTGYNGGGVEKQGMSDTRYLENGKYYYDIEAEKKLNPYNYDMTYSNNRFNNNNNNNNVFRNNNNNYNNNGQLYGNRENSREEYFNSYNTKFNNNNNGMFMQQGYKNQFPEEGEFDFDDQP